MTNISIKQTTPHISIRASGKQGQQGVKGDTGATGPQGPKGDPGTTDYNELENLPDLTLKADKANTYTKTEVDAALNSKANTTHTHTAANITDFDTEVSNNIDVAANTAARHTHANKAILDATSASYTSADKTKLDGIEAGAEVNTVTSVNTRTGAVAGLAEASDLTAHTGNASNPHSVTKAQVGLGNVSNLAPADMPVSTATQTALNAKANASDTVNLTGNQTVAGVKTFSSSPVVPAATTNTQAVNKAQMDTADALKVNKAGDTMTGQLIAPSYDVSGAKVLSGTGFPEGVVTAPTGSIYIDKAITNGASSWIKKSGTGSTGWKVLEGDTGLRNITSLAVGTPVFSGGVWVRRVGNIVTVSISDFESTWSAVGWLEIIAPATMAGFKPDTPGGENYNTILGSTFARMQVLSSGVLRVYSNSAGTFRIHNTISYITSSTWPTSLPGVAA